jgi:DNA-cytosine methyltransferase
MLQTKLKVLDLFSGIGGFSLGLESTGFFETIAFVEKDEFCQKVLKKNFNNIPIEGDIRNVKGDKYKADVVTGGFPCQPFSVAGKRKGTDDDRYLWDETIRVVRECKPKWFIGENVEGLVNIQDGMVLRQVQDDLEKEGFQVQCLIIPASGIGAWHQRKRIWIMGYSEHNGHTSTKIRKSSNQTNDNCKKGEYQTIKSEGTSTPRNNENVRMDVSNSNARFGIRENQEIQTRGNTSTTSSKDVSNTFGKLSDGCSSTTRNSKAKFKRVECNQSWNWNEVWSKTERCSEQDKHTTKRCMVDKLNPWWQPFVEFLMGYPMDWTKIEPTESKLLETQSFHKSQENLEKQSLKQKKMFRTPTSMDIGEDSFIYAAKILKGKVNRSSNSRVQITLSTDVAMEYLKNNPELIDQYDRPFMERPNLPNKLEFIEYLKSQTSIKKLSNNTDIPKTKIDHWFRKDNCFSYPSIEDWNIIKPFLKELKFNKELTYEIEKDWKE